jgi:uncharacterized membrane protein YagU involved in acid resistance
VMDWAGWATFGFVATVALTALMVGAQLAGLTRMDIPMMLGTMFVEDSDRARVIGFLVHLLNGQIFALLYAAGFALLERATWWLGAIFGALHGLAALTLIVPLLPGIHSRMASERGGPELNQVLEPPGLLALNYGRETPLVALGAHIIFGVTLGILLTPVP